MKSKMEGAALGVIHSLGFNWLAEMEKQCVCIIVSIAFLNNTLSDYFFFLIYLCGVAYGVIVIMLREDPSVILWETQDGLI